MTIVVSSTSETTALDIIKRALRLLGVYPSGEDLSPEESQDGLDTLNDLLDELSLGSMVYAKTLDTISLAANQASVTVGPSGATVTARPIQVLDESYILIGTQTYPLRVFSLQEYNDIGLKGQTSIPRGIWPQMNMPDITLTLWPVPGQTMTLNLWSQKAIASFPGLTSVVSLPPGYKKALSYLLAIDFAPEYEVEPSPTVLRGAASAKRMVEAKNFEPPMLTLPPEISNAGRFNILANTSI